MRKLLIAAGFALAMSPVAASAQTALSAYADDKGYIDVQKLTCAQLAGTFQEDADFLGNTVQRLVQRSCEETRDQGRSRQGRHSRSYRLLQGPPGQEGYPGDRLYPQGQEGLTPSLKGILRRAPVTRRTLWAGARSLAKTLHRAAV